jgi:Glycosyltransferase like family 2
MAKKFSVLIGCYGDYPQYSIRAVESVFVSGLTKELYDVHVGCNACGQETINFLRSFRDSGNIKTLIECGENLNKDPMMRLLIAVTRTTFLVWMDDDSHLGVGSIEAIDEFIDKHPQMDVAGHVFYIHRHPDYQRLAEARPWWPGFEALSEDQRERVFFPTGGLFIARTSFLRRHNFPDRNMVKKYDDVLLGDLVVAKGGRLEDFGHDPLINLIKISDGERRGTGEGEDGLVTNDDEAALL